MSVLSQPPPTLPHVLLVLCQLAFGVVHVSSKTALLYLPPFTFGALRVLLALPALWTFARWAEPGIHPCSYTDVMMYTFLGLTGVTGPQSLILVGVQMTSPDVVAIFQPTIPVWVAFLSAMMGLEQLSSRKVVGVSFAVVGALVMLDVTHIDLHSTQTLGMFVMLAQVMCYSVFIVTMAAVLKRTPLPFTVFSRASTIGAAVLVLIAAREVPQVAWAEVSTVAWVILLYCGLGVSFMAHASVSWAVQHVSPTIPSLYACLQPAAVTILSWLVYGDVLEWVDVMGMCLILAGLFVTVVNPGPSDAATLKGVSSTEECHLIQQVELQVEVFSATSDTSVDTQASPEDRHLPTFLDSSCDV